MIYELSHNDQIKCQNVNYEKFANLTEGYTIGYLLQFIERAIFYAHRNGWLSERKTKIFIFILNI